MPNPIPLAEHQCVVCGGRLQPDKIVVKCGHASLMACPTCQSWTSLPRLTASEQSAIHDTAEYFDHPYFEHRRNKEAATQRRCREIFKRIEIALGSPLQGLSVLDVGCDTGVFLACAAREYGVVPFGVDVSNLAVQRARQMGLHVYHGTIDVIPASQKFKIITVTDVIEHVPDPALLLGQLYDHLEPGGVVYVQTPNLKSTIYQLGCWLSKLRLFPLNGIVERLFPPQHIQYFSRRGFVHLVQERGFAFVKLENRMLPVAELGVSISMLLPLTMLQLIDMLFGRQILLCALLQRPLGAAIANN